MSKLLLDKARAFVKVTNEKFMVMATIASKVNVNLPDILFKNFTTMVKNEAQSPGFSSLYIIFYSSSR